MNEYPVKKNKVKIFCKWGTFIGDINIEGFSLFSEYMDHDKSSYLKLFNIDKRNSHSNFFNLKEEDNFILIPKSENNLYIPMDEVPKK